MWPITKSASWPGAGSRNSQESTLHCVLLPGLHGTGELFGPFIAAAPPNTQIVVVNYPTAETAIDALAQFVREKLPNPCIVIAESFSGPIAIRVAADPRVRALVLCNSFVRSPHPAALRHLVFAPLCAVPLPDFVVRFALLGRHADRQLLSSVQVALRKLRPRVIAGRVRQVLRTDEREALHRLSKPLLYLRGLDDQLLSERSWNDILAVRPDAVIVRLPGPHLLLQTSPERCWRAVLGFAEEFVFN